MLHNSTDRHSNHFVLKKKTLHHLVCHIERQESQQTLTHGSTYISLDVVTRTNTHNNGLRILIKLRKVRKYKPFFCNTENTNLSLQISLVDL